MTQVKSDHGASAISNAEAGRRVEWLFDVISPFAYLAFETLSSTPFWPLIQFRPVLLAGLLSQHGQKGPAEIPAKRLMTYRLCAHLARKRDLPFRMPDHHPFNPLHALRLLTALDAPTDAVRKILGMIYGEGIAPDTEQGQSTICERLGVREPEDLIDSCNARDRLRTTTQQAADAGVFGVPTLQIDDELFWGGDALELAVEYWNDPGLFKRAEWASLATVPIGAERTHKKAGVSR